MLLLVGMGLNPEKDLPIGSAEALKNCDEVYAESYTNAIPREAIEAVGARAGKKIFFLSRADVEGEKFLVEKAGGKKENSGEKTIALLVPGDPMMATTHVSLILAARKAGVRTKVLHAGSILSAAIGESGLQAYKFGKIVTLPYWRDNYKPVSTLDVIEQNLSRELHTLVLLDIDEKIGPMEPKGALRALLSMADAKKSGDVHPQTPVVVLCRVGYPEQRVLYGSISSILDGHADATPATIIVPAKLHFLEQEYLETCAICCGI